MGVPGDWGARGPEARPGRRTVPSSPNQAFSRDFVSMLRDLGARPCHDHSHRRARRLPVRARWARRLAGPLWGSGILDTGLPLPGGSAHAMVDGRAPPGRHHRAAVAAARHARSPPVFDEKTLKAHAVGEAASLISAISRGARRPPGWAFQRDFRPGTEPGRGARRPRYIGHGSFFPGRRGENSGCRDHPEERAPPARTPGAAGSGATSVNEAAISRRYHAPGTRRDMMRAVRAP